MSLEETGMCPERKDIRLKGYDYSLGGAYYLTICTQNRLCLFGYVDGIEMQTNDAGRMIAHWWMELAHKFTDVMPDTHIVMPNHIHGIVVIKSTVGADLRVCPSDNNDDNEGEHTGSPLRPSLSRIIQWLKTMTTNEYIDGVRNNGWTPFDHRLWQRNYYEHIIRNATSHRQIVDYIANNPNQWANDNYFIQ
jgi:REP element-mobilizing transposase RayT